MTTTLINVEEGQELKMRLKILAARKNMSMTNLVTKILLDAIKKMEDEEKK